MFSLVKQPLVAAFAANHELSTTQNITNPPPMARIDNHEPFPGRNLPKTTMSGAAAKLKIGMSQAHSIRLPPGRSL